MEKTRLVQRRESIQGKARYKYEWYFGSCSRQMSERLLLHPANESGAFLIRPSESIANGFSLSVRDIHAPSGVRHYPVIPLETGGYTVSKRRGFRSLPELLAYYSANAEGLGIRLTKACLRVQLAPAVSENDSSSSPPLCWEIPRSSLTLNRILGEGIFGVVWEGLYNNRYPVAIKSLKPGKMEPKDFLVEAAVMKKLRHPQLLKLYAVCTNQEPIYIITELMRNGNLLNFLRSNGQKLRLPNLIDFGAQIASGMAYLEAQNYIHRDLAARNVLLGDHFEVKIADFGLARFNPEMEYQAREGTRFPVKWTAPEAATHHKFSTKSDVWSFGIVLSELITFGGVPYPGLTHMQALEAVKRGYRMARPAGCPVALYEIMLECWHAVPVKRPTFETLKYKLEDFFTSLGPDYREASSVPL